MAYVEPRKEFGVFHWNADWHYYTRANAVRVFKNEKAAEKFARRDYEAGNKGNLVVRDIAAADNPSRTKSRRNKVRRTTSRRNAPKKICAMCPGELPPSNTTGVCSTCREALRRRVDGSDVVRARQLRRKATARNNPPRMIGYTAKLFYERTVGRVPGYYKHEFTTPAEVIVNPTARDLKPGCVLLRPEDE